MTRDRTLTAHPIGLAIALTCALGAALLLGAPAPAGAQIQIQPAQPLPVYCLATVDPQPSGVTARPPHNFTTYPDYNYVHSSTHLSGKRTTEKFAPGLYWYPPVPLELSGLRSSIKVTNPDPTLALTANVEFYDQGGALVGLVPVNLAPEASATVPAASLAAGSPAGLGSARVVSTNGVELVGETIHHTLSFDLGAYGGPVVTDPDPFNPGASSLQQLQARQDTKTSLYMGPFPVSDQTPLDILNGNNPLFWIQNPNATPTTVNVSVFSRLGVNFGTTTATLQPYASLLDLRLWNALWPAYLSGAINYDDDFLVVVTADQGIVGEFLMTDLFQNGAGPGSHLNLGGRFRMGSGMLSNSPALRVVNPEFTYQPSNLGIETVMGVLNAGSGDIGPLNVQYRDRNGNIITSYNIASLPRGAMLRFGPGISPYPGATFDGWVRITACKPGLVGWTMRTAGDSPDAVPPPFKKVWGEVLAGANGAEPGNGFTVTVGQQNWVRKVGSFVRVDPSFYWPGYTAFVNHASSNIGPYWYRYHLDNGTNVTNPAGQPFAGLMFADTSFTFEDPYVSFFGATNLSERVDRTTGKIQGIHVIGDPLVEWGIFGGVVGGGNSDQTGDPVP